MNHRGATRQRNNPKTSPVDYVPCSAEKIYRHGSLMNIQTKLFRCSNTGQTAVWTVAEPISVGDVSVTVTVQIRLLTDNRIGMDGVNDNDDVYVVSEDKYEIKD